MLFIGTDKKYVKTVTRTLMFAIETSMYSFVGKVQIQVTKTIKLMKLLRLIKLQKNALTKQFYLNLHWFFSALLSKLK